MRRGDPGWPLTEPKEWVCSLGQDCDEGWFITPATEPGQADDARRCPCVVHNIRERKRHAALERDARDYSRAGDW